MEFPKTIIITINTHGGIDCIKEKSNDNNYLYPIITVPDSIKKLTIIDSVPFGIDIYIDDDEIINYTNVITDNFYQKYNVIDDIDPVQINKIIDNTVNYIKNKTIDKYKKNKNIDKEYSRCLQSKNIYENKYFYPNDKIVNKIFCYEMIDKTNSYNNIQIINNKLNHIDLFDLVKKKKYFDGYETTLENILHFLSSKCVENVIIYDFSCYTFVHNDKISDRTIRNFRREINHKLNNKRKFDMI
jgi:hypothetical protein